MNKNEPLAPSISQREFGQLETGEMVDCFTLTNNNALSIEILNYGAIIRTLVVKNNRGSTTDIVLGYDTLEGYVNDPYYLGAIVGRYAGRIANGKLTIDGKSYQLSCNTPIGQLHGGESALNKQVWQAETQINTNSVALILHYTSPDGHNGFPGEVNFKIIYTLHVNNEFTMEYFAKSNQPTLVNLTQHSYFNLAGHQHGNIDNHHLTLTAEHFLPMTADVFPTGEIASVSRTPYDFTQGKKMADDLYSKHPQIVIGKGYDNYWLNSSAAIEGKIFNAKLSEPSTGITLTLYTDQPCLIMYSSNYIDGSQVGKSNCRYQEKSAICIEPQRAFDFSLTNEDYQPFNSSVLRPETPFYSKTRWLFNA